jgi:hypothetical protein
MDTHDGRHGGDRRTWSSPPTAKPSSEPLTADDVPTVELSVSELRRFAELTRSLRLLRWTKGRWSSMPIGPVACALGAVVGTVVMFGSLGRLPTPVSFAGYLLTLGAVARYASIRVGGRRP